MPAPPAPGTPPLTVTELNRRARLLLEDGFGVVWVAGELSRVTQAPSGHWYFVLKDEGAAVDCAMFRGRAQYLDFRPENGTRVEVRARVGLYEPRGAFQLGVEQMRKAGLGALFEAFEKLKAKLAAEGLFDEAAKRPLPGYPRAIGIVTSPAAAALRDILATLRRRAPMIPVIVYPTLVQGEAAPAQIVAALGAANARAEVDTLIVARGGGSLEDLWAFNDERVARAIAGSAIPVVSGVGHETDVTIADFVADLRAATPTAAAAAASPDGEAIAARLAVQARTLSRAAARAIEGAMQRLDLASRRLLKPGERLARSREELADLARRLSGAARASLRYDTLALAALAPRLRSAAPDLGRERRGLRLLASRLAPAAKRLLREREARLGAARASLAHLDPAQVLRRGYALARTPDGRLVRAGRSLAAGDHLSLTFAEGGAEVTVERAVPSGEEGSS